MPQPKALLGQISGSRALLVRGHLAFGVFCGTPGAIRGESSVADLIKQRAVTDIQSPGRLFPVPVVVMQHLQNNLALQGSRSLTREFLERDRSVKIDVRR